MQRIRCDKNPADPDGTCLTCKRVNFAKTGQLPCLRYKIADIALYKSGQVPGFEWTRRWSNEVSDPIDTWASPEVRTIRISEGYSDSVVELQVRQFVPMEGDKLERTWDYNGEKKSVRIPPFALVDTHKTRKAFARHIDASVDDTLKNVIRSVEGTLGKWMRVTYLEAFRLAQRSDAPPEVSKILQSTFRLWTSTRLNTISCFIVGEETLGMPSDILDDTSPTPGKVPVPPVMGAQLNLIMIHEIQAKLRKTVLEQLQKIVQKNKHSTWLVTYFVNFILLHNASMIISHDAGTQRRFAREDKVKEYHIGANIILAYFHYCNKGLYPFSDECSDSELKSLAELNENDVKFVRCTANYARAREAEWRRLRESQEYHHPEYYISQMFEQNWKPRSMVV
ncbi:tetratricopeptide repeat domain containing protein [Beauveria brongniartii RCEF 3172]|uniref:Tetratricopeptide repeat domain containing protein n=1 Tax=Beauveria brongniartii RCEF 3172 TaxID=1081107 RepID=A0A166YUM8_9HYPO|nr:tetratricopeptide repeat domain containing protein [Beauveria brongniartii RCEF 3172]